jgi:hypothetical protein
MTHEGQAAARVSGGCFVMGQAAGTAASQLAAGQIFANTDLKHLQKLLKMDGVYFDNDED